MEDLSFLYQFKDIYSIFTSFTSIIGLILFVIKGFAILELSKKTGLKKGFLGFIPVVWVYQFGKIAEKYKENNPKKNYGISLLVLSIIQYILTGVFLVLLISSLIKIYNFAESAVIENTVMELSMFSSLVPVIISYFVLLAIIIAFVIIKYIAFFKICKLFDFKNATVFTVLSVIFSFLMPIFLFVMRKNEINEN